MKLPVATAGKLADSTGFKAMLRVAVDLSREIQEKTVTMKFLIDLLEADVKPSLGKALVNGCELYRHLYQEDTFDNTGLETSLKQYLEMATKCSKNHRCLVALLEGCAKAAEQGRVEVQDLDKVRENLEDAGRTIDQGSVQKHVENESKAWGPLNDLVQLASNLFPLHESWAFHNLWAMELKMESCMRSSDHATSAKGGATDDGSEDENDGETFAVTQITFSRAVSCCDSARHKHHQLFDKLLKGKLKEVTFDEVCRAFRNTPATSAAKEIDAAKKYNTSSRKETEAVLPQLIEVAAMAEKYHSQVSHILQAMANTGCKEPSNLKKFHSLVQQEDRCWPLSELSALLPAVDSSLQHFGSSTAPVLDSLAHKDATAFWHFLREATAEKFNFRSLDSSVEEAYGVQHLSRDTRQSLIDVQWSMEAFLRSPTKAYKIEEFAKKLKAAVERQEDLGKKVLDGVLNLKRIQELKEGMGSRQRQASMVVRAALSGGVISLSLSEARDCTAAIRLECSDGTKYDHAKLEDLRNTALLLWNRSKDTVSNLIGQPPEDTQIEELRIFIEIVDQLLEICRILSKLCSSGHVEFRKFEKVLRLSHQPQIMQEIVRLKSHLAATLESWEMNLEVSRRECFYLNFFWGRQLSLLEDTCRGSFRGLEQRHFAEQSPIHLVAKRESCERAIQQMSVMDIGDLGHEERLQKIGGLLESALGENPWAESEVDLGHIQCQDKATVSPGELFVAVLEPGSARILPTVVSLYLNTVRSFPMPSQILFCHEDIAVSEIELFLERCHCCAQRGIVNALFCLIHPERLTDEVRFSLVRRLLAPQHPRSLLAVVSEVERGGFNYVVEQLHDYKHTSVPLLDRDSIQQITVGQFHSYLVLTSDIPGLGKTDLATERAFQLNRPMVTFSVSGVISRRGFVNSLKALRLSGSKALHLCLGDVSDYELLDVLLFELLVLGTVVAGDDMYHLPTNIVFVELANTLSNRLQDSLQVTKWLPNQCLKGFDLNCFEISSEILSPVQVVCNYLDARQSGDLMTNDIIFSEENCTARSLSPAKCHALLQPLLKDGDVSFSLLHALLNILSDQLVKLSSSLFFRCSNLQNMVGYETACTLRSLIVDKLVTTSVENTMRSVVNSREAQADAAERMSTTEALKGLSVTRQPVTGNEMVNRVEGMIRWDETNHVLIMFNSSDAQTITILYRDVAKVDGDIRKLMAPQGYMLSTKKDSPLPPLQQLNQTELEILLCRFSRSAPMSTEETSRDKKYTLTADNLLKMALIVQRIRAHVPVIIMGETGCGKTSLVRYLAQTCCVEFRPFPIHAGTRAHDIEATVKSAEKKAVADKTKVWLFLDEINTCDHLGLLSDIICHHKMNGKPLLRDVIFIAACNPYRLRPQATTDKAAGLQPPSAMLHRRPHGPAGIPASLLYRVHPLPETMMDYVWDYGSLEAKDEEEYIRCMHLSAEVPDDQLYHPPGRGQTTEAVTTAVITAHQFVQRHGNATMATSLRDVERCLRLMEWWKKHIRDLKCKGQEIANVDSRVKACILSLAICYDCRLADSEVRQKFRKKISGQLCEDLSLRMKQPSELFTSVVKRYQKVLLETMKKRPEWTAENTALLENVFVILVSLMNKIPVLVVGKPGSSKSLAMKIIAANVLGKKSDDDFLKKLPALDIVPYQGSTSSTSQGIEQVFENAEGKVEEGVLPVVLLDEIGLAEVSPANPLKVLHNKLEPADGRPLQVGVVGISNFLLDAAKMNRAIQLLRPDPDSTDLSMTARSIRNTIGQYDLLTENDLGIITKAYMKYQEDLNQTHKFANFHGLRDFYYLVKGICLQMSNLKKDGHGPVQLNEKDPKERIWMKAFARNFGGLPQDAPHIQKHIGKNRQDDINVLELIADNISDPAARHLLLLTNSSAGLHILKEQLVRKGTPPRIMYGSQMKEDQTERYIYNVLSEIILFMESGGVLVLCNLDPLYGSLYDMLNQSYDTSGVQNFCRVAIGAHSNPVCRVNDKFRCIVIMDEERVQSNDDDRAFLNRFEKQRLSYANALQHVDSGLLSALQSWVEKLRTVRGDQLSAAELFVGYNEDMLPSLVLHNYRQESESQADSFLRQCKEDLLWVATPEAIWRLPLTSLPAHEVAELSKLYSQQCHSGLPQVLRQIQEFALCEDEGAGAHDKPWTSKTGGTKVLAMTYSSFFKSNIAELFDGENSPFNITLCKLGAYQSEKQLTAHIIEYFKSETSNLFVLQCHAPSDVQHILHAQFILDRLCSESSFAKFPKHVCMVIHLARGKSAAMPHFSFQCGWRQVMLDTLKRSPVPLKVMARLSMEQFFTEEYLSCEKIVRKHLSEALLEATPPSKRLSEETKLLVCKIRDNSGCVHLLTAIVLDHLDEVSCSEDEDGSSSQQRDAPPEWQTRVACNQTVLYGSRTFSQAIMNHVSECIRLVLKRLLSFMNRHRLLPLLLPEGDTSNHGGYRAQLACDLLKMKSLTGLTKSLEDESLEFEGMYWMEELSTRFPFASLFFSRIEQHRTFFFQTAEKLEFTNAPAEEIGGLLNISLNSVLGAAALLKGMARAALEEVPDGGILAWNCDYLEEFIDQKTFLYRRTVSEKLRFALVCFLMEPYWPEKARQLQCDLPDLAIHAHSSFWMVEAWLHPLLVLCGLIAEETDSSCQSAVSASISSSSMLYQSLARASNLLAEAPVPEEREHDDKMAEALSQLLPGELAAYRLLEILCHHLLKIVTHVNTSTRTWNQLVCRFLALSSQVTCVRSPSLYALRVCSDAMKLFNACQPVVQFVGWFAQTMTFSFSEEMLTEAVSFATTAKSNQLINTEAADDFVLRFFAHWLDAHTACEHPPLVEKILRYLSGMDYSSDKLLISPIVHRVLIYLDDHAADLLRSRFGQDDFSSEVLLALNSVLAEQPIDSFLTTVVQDTLLKSCSFREDVRSEKDQNVLLQSACTVLRQSPASSFQLIVAVACIQTVLEGAFKELSTDLASKIRTDQAKPRAATLCKVLEGVFSLQAGDSSACQEQWQARREGLKCYLARLINHIPESSHVWPVIRDNLPSVQQAWQAMQFLDGGIRKTVTPLALTPGYQPARDACAALLTGRQKLTKLTQQLESCVTDAQARRALFCAFAQLFYLKPTLDSQVEAEQRAVEEILSCDQLQELPPLFTKAIRSVLKPSKFNIALLQQVPSDTLTVQTVTILLHLLAILSASANTRCMSPFVRLFMDLKLESLEEMDDNGVAHHQTQRAASGAMNEAVKIYECSCGCVFGPTTDQDRSPPCINVHCPTRFAPHRSGTLAAPKVVELQTTATETSSSAPEHDRSRSGPTPQKNRAPLSVQIFNLLCDAVLLLGLAVCPSNDFDGHCKKVMKHFHDHTKQGQSATVVEFLEARIKQRWHYVQANLNATSGEVSLILHGCLRQCADLLVDDVNNGWFTLCKKFKETTRDLQSQPFQVIRKAGITFISAVEEYCGAGERAQLCLLQRVMEVWDCRPADQKEAEQVNHLFRQTRVPSNETLSTEFFRDPGNTESYPVACLFLQRCKELALLASLPALLHWNKLVVARLSGKQTRDKVGQTSVEQFIETHQDKSRRQSASMAFEAMTKNWDKLAPGMKEAFGLQLVDFHLGSDMTSVFVNSTEQGSSFYRVVSMLCKIQSSYLAAVLNLQFEKKPECLSFLKHDKATSSLPTRSLVSATDSNLIAFDYEELMGRLAIFSQVSPLSGLGRQVCYDFEQVERRIVEETIVQKSLLLFDENERDRFKFAGEIFHTQQDPISGVRETFPQEGLPEDVDLEAVLSDEEYRLQMKSELELILSQLLHTGGDVEETINSYRRDWPFEPIPPSCEAVFDQVKLRHVVALYEAVEVDKNALAMLQLPRNFKEPELPEEVLQGVLLQIQSRLSLADCLDVLQRFAYRHLNLANVGKRREHMPNSNTPMMEYLGNVYVWPASVVKHLLGIDADTPEELVQMDSGRKASFKQSIAEVFVADVKFAHTGHLLRELLKIADVSFSQDSK